MLARSGSGIKMMYTRQIGARKAEPRLFNRGRDIVTYAVLYSCRNLVQVLFLTPTVLVVCVRCTRLDEYDMVRGLAPGGGAW